MKYNPHIHHRRSIRLKGYDYSQSGAYFITICCHKMECRFGNIVGAGFTPAPAVWEPWVIAEMDLNEYGMIAHNEWTKLPDRFGNFELDVFQIMPNHIHGIIVLTEPISSEQKGQPRGIAPTDDAVGAEFTPALSAESRNPILGDIVGAYKSLVANQ